MRISKYDIGSSIQGGQYKVVHTHPNYWRSTWHSEGSLRMMLHFHVDNCSGRDLESNHAIEGMLVVLLKIGYEV